MLWLYILSDQQDLIAIPIQYIYWNPNDEYMYSSDVLGHLYTTILFKKNTVAEQPSRLSLDSVNNANIILLNCDFARLNIRQRPRLSYFPSTHQLLQRHNHGF